MTGAEITLQDNDEQVTSAELSLTRRLPPALVTVTATLDAVTSAGLSIHLRHRHG